MIQMKNKMTKENTPKQKKSFIGSVIKTLILSLFFSILIECIGITFWWTDEPQHSQEMLNDELNYLSNDFRNSLIMSEPANYANSVLKIIYKYLFIKSGIQSVLNESEPSFIVYLIQSIADYLTATINVILVFIVRLFIILLSLPIFILAALTGVVDGLVRRDIRRFGAGRESSFIYHHSKKWIGRLLIFSWLFYLSIPISIHPNIIFIPMATLFGLSIHLTVGSFKKYL